MKNRVSAKAVGKRIRKLRGRLSQQQFADLMGISQIAVSRYERGLQLPIPESLAALAEVCDISIDWLLTGHRPVSGGSEEM